MNIPIYFDKIITQHINAPWLQEQKCSLDILRLDLVHPEISGNKWFKLQYYIQDALAKRCEQIGTFGGAYSNHIVAAAYAAKHYGLSITGVIRGERPAVLSPSLADAERWGMQLLFVSREAYLNKEELKKGDKNIYWINEGGYGTIGAAGAADILKYTDIDNYTHIICAVGSGTMLAGIINSMLPHQQAVGISVMKGNTGLQQEVEALVDAGSKQKKFTISHDYHFGGYAKHPPELIAYMQLLWQQHQLPTDIVYTSKTFYALEEMIKTNNIPAGSRVLMIHSGGLQGNRSLPGKTLHFI